MMRRLLPLLLSVLLLVACGGKKTEPTLAVSAEQKGAGLVIRVKAANFTFGKDGHAHVRLNGGPEAMIYADTYTIPTLTPGLYRIDVELANVKHEPLGVHKSVEYEVKP